MPQTDGIRLRAKCSLDRFILSPSGGGNPYFWPYLRHLHPKFHLNVFIVLASGGQKPQFWANFDILAGFFTDPLLPMMDKFNVL